MRYLVVGYYGYGNAGDEVLLRQTIQLIKASDPTAALFILHPKLAKSAAPPGTFPVDRFNPFVLLRTIASVDRVVFGGGGIFQDQTSLKSLVYYTTIVLMAWALGRPPLLLGQGFSRPKRKISAVLITIVLKCSNWIGCRDVESFHQVQGLVINKKTHLTGDLAFLCDSPPVREPGPAIGVSLRQHPFGDPVTNLLLNWINQEPRPLIGVSFEGAADACALKQVGINNIMMMGDTFPETPGLTRPLIVVAMRYHACLWAALNKIPFIALAYDDKVVSLSKALQQRYIDLRRLNQSQCNDLATQVADVLSNINTYTGNIESLLPHMISGAKKNQSAFNG